MRHGHLPEREIMTGIGPVAVRAPRVRDRTGQGADRIRFSSALLPPYARRSKSLEVLIPVLYLTGIIDAILEADTDPDVPRKQRHTAHRIFERLRDEHWFTGGYTIVKDYVRARRQSTREAFVPLHHPPGHAQVDFGEAVVELRGQREKIAFFCLILPHSNIWFVKAYPTRVCRTSPSSLDSAGVEPRRATHISPTDISSRQQMTSRVCDGTRPPGLRGQAAGGRYAGVLMTRWGRVVSSGASSNDTSHPGMDGGDFGERHRRGRRPGRAGPRPCVALERAGKVAPGRAIARASRAPHQVRPSLPLFSFPSASDSGDAGSCIAGSPVDTPVASSRSGSTSGGAPDEPSSPAAAEADAASDQRLPRDSYLPCFRPFRNSSRIDGSLISRSTSVAARASISCTVEPELSRKACSTKRGTEPLGARLLPPARRFAAAPGLPRLAPVGVARFPPAPRISNNAFLASDWPRA